MRWKTFLFTLTIVLTFMMLPIIISIMGEILAKRYGCQERASNAHIPIGEYLNCGGDAVESRARRVINMDLWVLFTFPIGIFVITLLVLIQVISRLMQRSPH